MQDDPIMIGVDVSKAELVIAGMPDQRACCVANSKADICLWLKTLPSNALIAMESTGPYHQALALEAFKAGFVVFVLNAKDVYFSAKAQGRRGKSDRNDAESIVHYLREHVAHLHPWCPGSEAQQRIGELQSHRSTMVTHQVALRKVLSIDGLRRHANGLEKKFESILKAIDAEIERLIGQDAVMAAARERLMSVTGIGMQTSVTLAVLLERIPFRNADAFIAYSGLDPRPMDSGAKRGKRRLTKRGPPLLRRQAYMAAFAACHSKVFKPVYLALRARGFSTTESLVILARKILRTAWAVWKSGQPFDPARVAKSA